MNNKTKYIEKLVFTSAAGTNIINQSEIIYCESARNNTHLFLNDRSKKKVTKGLKYIECRLDTDRFFRIHDSYIVNLLHVKMCESNGSAHIITLLNGEKLPVARTRICKFRKGLRYIRECYEPS